MNLLVICAVIGAIFAAIVAILARQVVRNKRISQAKLRAAKRQIRELVNNTPHKINSSSTTLAVVRSNQLLMLSKDDIIAKLLDDNPDLAGDPEFIEMWAYTEPGKLKG